MEHRDLSAQLLLEHSTGIVSRRMKDNFRIAASNTALDHGLSIYNNT